MTTCSLCNQELHHCWCGEIITTELPSHSPSVTAMRETRWLDDLLREVRPLVRSDVADDALNRIVLQLERIRDSLPAEVETEAADERKTHREFKLALLDALGVADPWAITTWRQAEYCAAIERLRPASTPEEHDRHA